MDWVIPTAATMTHNKPTAVG